MRTFAASILLAASIAQPSLAQTTPGASPPAGATAPTPAPAVPASPPTTSPTPAPSAGTQPSVAVAAPPATPTRQMPISALTEKDLAGANSGELGEIDRVVESNADKKHFLVISHGGFLGFFKTDVAVPLENVAVRGDQVVAQNLTEEQLKALPKFENDNNAYRVLDNNQTLTLTEVK